MKNKALLILTLFCGINCMFAGESAPSLSLPDAAKIIEKALKEEKLPDDHFLRTIQLRKQEDGSWVYFAYYTPPERRRASSRGKQPEPVTLRFITLNMNGEISLEEEIRTPSVSPKRKVVNPDDGGQ